MSSFSRWIHERMHTHEFETRQAYFHIDGMPDSVLIAQQDICKTCSHKCTPRATLLATGSQVISARETTIHDITAAWGIDQ